MQDALASGIGMARSGGMNLRYGRRGAVIETATAACRHTAALSWATFAPRLLLPLQGGLALSRSPGAATSDHEAQGSPSHTERPAVEFENPRVTNHPRSAGYIDAQRFTPGHEPEDPHNHNGNSQESEAWLQSICEAQEASPKPPHGIAGDRFVVELRGQHLLRHRSKTGGIAGGPYRRREAAQSRADSLQEPRWTEVAAWSHHGK